MFLVNKDNAVFATLLHLIKYFAILLQLLIIINLFLL